MSKRRTRRMTICLALGAVIICALVVRVMIYARLPDITEEGTVPVILVADGKVLLAAWQPEAVTLDVGTRKPIGTLSASCSFGPFAQVQRMESLVCGIAATCLTSWNHQVLSLTTMPQERFAQAVPYAYWWSGTGANLTTANVWHGVTGASPLVKVPVRLTVTNSANQTISVDLPHDPVDIGMLTARGDLQDGFILLQWQARGESVQPVEQQIEHLLLVRLRNGRASTHDVTRDEHFNQEDYFTWIQKPQMTDRFDSYACTGQNLYIVPGGNHAGNDNHVWTLDLDTSSPVIHLDQMLTNLANSLPSDNAGWSSFYLADSGPYLLVAMPLGVGESQNTWAIRDDKVVGQLSTRDGVVRVSAGNLSTSRSIKRLTDVKLPSAGAFSPF
jgi:hypothetical protein